MIHRKPHIRARHPLAIALMLALASTAAAQEAAESDTGTAETAQENPEQKAEAEETARVMDTVTVTAQSREQEIKDVPISMQVIDQTLIRELAATNLGDLDGFMPGVKVDDNSPTQPRYEIRGISTGDFGIGTESAVGIYIDGVYASRSGGSMLAFNDVARIEVLKGPQGTLFGRNTAAGAISVISNRPVQETEGELVLRAGNDGQQYVYGLYNMPVTDSSAMRLSYVSNQSDGWMQDAATGQEYGGQDNWAARVAWRTIFGNGMILDLSYDHEAVDQLARPAIGLIALDPNDPFAQAPYPADPDTYLNPLNAPIYNDVVDNNESRTFDGVTLQLNQSYDWASMTFSAAYRSFSTNNREDEDGTNKINLYFDTQNIEDNSSFYTELKFNGVNGPVDWVAGASWYEESAEQTSNTHLYTNGADTLYNNNIGFQPWITMEGALIGNGVPATVLGQTWLEQMINSGDYTAAAVFGDAIWHVNDKLNLTLGLRYTYDKKTFTWYNGAHIAPELNATLAFLASPVAGNFLQQYYAFLDGIFPGASTLYSKDIVWDYSAFPGVEGNVIETKNSWSNISPRFVIDYAISDNMMVWGSYTAGYKAGGYNSVEINSYFDSEDVDNFEIGIKSDFPDQRLSVSSSLFSYVYNDKQAITLVSTGDVPMYQVTTSDVEAWGWDLQVYWNPLDGLMFNLGSQYIDQSYKDFITPEGDDLSGQDTGLPKWNVTVGGSYSWLFEDASMLTLSANYGYRSGNTCNTASTIQGTCQVSPNFDVGGAQNRTDARLQWTSPEEVWGVGVYARNLFDQQYVNGVNNITNQGVFGTPFASISDPRQYGLEASYNF